MISMLLLVVDIEGINTPAVKHVGSDHEEGSAAVFT